MVTTGEHIMYFFGGCCALAGFGLVCKECSKMIMVKFTEKAAKKQLIKSGISELADIEFDKLNIVTSGALCDAIENGGSVPKYIELEIAEFYLERQKDPNNALKNLLSKPKVREYITRPYQGLEAELEKEYGKRLEV